MTEIVNLSISQSAASELSRQASFGGSPGEMSIDLVEDKNCSEGWMHIKLRPGTCNGSPISRTEGVTLYADVKKFNLLKDLKLDYYGDLSGGGSVSYTHLRAHETGRNLVCRLLLEKKDTSILEKFKARTTGITFCIFWC